MPAPGEGPGAAAHHHLPAGQQQRSRLVASHAREEEWRGGEEEEAPPRLKSPVDSLPWRPSGLFGLDFMAWLFGDLPQHSLAGPGGGHEAAAATVTSAWKGNSETCSGGWVWGSCRNVAWASGVAQSGGDAHLAPALTQHQHSPDLGEAAAEEIKLLREKGRVRAHVLGQTGLYSSSKRLGTARPSWPEAEREPGLAAAPLHLGPRALPEETPMPRTGAPHPGSQLKCRR